MVAKVISTAALPAARKGARTIAAIPKSVRRALDEGREQTKTLVEWLAIDQAKLLASVLPAAGFAPAMVARAVASQRAIAASGITVRVRQAGVLLHGLLRELSPAAGRRAFAALATHCSDMVRSFACYVHAADVTLDLPARLAVARPFAADAAMSVRECAWDSYRLALTHELPNGLRLLQAWATDADPNIRRCAIESSRPRGVWTHHLEALKADPAPALPLLEPCRADPSDYVRRAVANWLNDASKTRPEWVTALTKRWLRESRCNETAWIARRAMRTLRKGERG
ncbi:MAG: DNA alkylation repair protein [Planctomycetes bacterium]|nr:DNA alkylation repair protein [Planctomycetota bacterium]